MTTVGPEDQPSDRVRDKKSSKLKPIHNSNLGDLRNRSFHAAICQILNF
jgi:hypothetical protein